MQNIYKPILILTLTLAIISCNTPKPQPKDATLKKVELVTNYGTMVMALYNETPLHRDNFINLAKNHAFDSLLFHRVIKNFVIQAGDPNSKHAKADSDLGDGDAPYLVEAEIHPELFHKKGALAAARDDIPSKASSAMQFYIVQGKIQTDSLLDKAEVFTNQNKARDYFLSKGENLALLDSIRATYYSGQRSRYLHLMDSVLSLATTQPDFTPYTMPDKFRNVYKTTGGYPRLDQNYTVFGEVIKGLDIVDSIAKVDTNTKDRPLKAVRIISLKVLED